MRGGDDIIAAEEWALDRRLLGEDVDRRTGDVAAVEGGGQVALDDETAACAIDEAYASLHGGERAGVDQVPSRLGQRRVQGDEVGAGQERLESSLPAPE